MADTRNAYESKLIQDFVSNNESTMRIVSNSVGMVLLRLSKYYFPDEAEKDKAIVTCCEQIEKLAETKSSDVRLAVINMMKEAAAPVNKFDKVTLRFEAKSTAETELKNAGKQQEPNYISKECVFPLKEVLTVVWTALTDDSKFSHHYEKENDETARSNAAQSHRESRIANFFNCFQEVETGVCRHGKRNAFVALLNLSYQDVNLILDQNMVVMAFLRDRVRNFFWSRYEDKTIQSEQRKELNAALLQWIAKDNPSLVLKLADPYNESLHLLEDLFIQNGTHPCVVKKILNDASESLLFFHDLKHAPHLAAFHGVFAVLPIQNHEARNKMLVSMQEWIQKECNWDDVADQKKVADFYTLFMADMNLKKHDLLLEITGEKEKLNALIKACSEYFMEEKMFREISPDTLKAVDDLTSAINRAQKDNFLGSIENFFSRWFVAEIAKNKKEQQKLYAMLCDDTVQSKIILDDDVIKKLIAAKAAEQKEFTATPYEVNRVFLHAILVDPVKWTSIFVDLFLKVMLHVKNKFNVNAGAPTVFEKNSYPAKLLLQMDYLLGKHWGEGIISRPEMVLLLPDNIRKSEEWFFVSRLLPVDQRGRIYQAYAVNIKTLILDELRKVSSRNEKTRDFLIRALSSVPLPKINDFLPELVKDGSGLAEIIKLYVKERRIAVLHCIGKTFVQKTINDAYEFVKLLDVFPESDRHAALKLLDAQFIKDKCFKDAKALDLTRIIKCAKLSNRCSLLEYLVDNLSYITIANEHDLAKILPVIPREEHGNTIEWWFNKGIVKWSASDPHSMPAHQLVRILKSVSDDNRIEIVYQLQEEFLQLLALNGYQWAAILDAAPEYWSEPFGQYYSKIITNGEQLRQTVMKIDNNNRLDFLSKLDTSFLRKIIHSVYELEQLLDMLPANNRENFLSALGNDFLCHKIKSTDDLGWVLKRVLEKKQIGEIDNIGANILMQGSRSIDFNAIARRIPSIDQVSYSAKKNLLLALVYAYRDQRSVGAEYTSVWGSFFGYHKNAKLAGAAALIAAIKEDRLIEKNGVLNTGNLGEIASVYESLFRAEKLVAQIRY